MAPGPCGFVMRPPRLSRGERTESLGRQQAVHPRDDIRRNRVCKILDVVDRIEYFADLGVNAIMPLPFQEYQGENSLGYNGTDLLVNMPSASPSALIPVL